MKNLIIILFLIFAMNAGAQNITYKYDNAGNRIERVINMTLKSVTESSVYTSIDDNIATKEIKIYPNPTKGELAVEVSDYSEGIKGDIYLYDMSGGMIDKKPLGSGKTYFNLTANPAGIYLMKINLNGESSVWKIIKE